MPIFDTHAHYDADQFASDREAVLAALPAALEGARRSWKVTHKEQ